MAAKTFYLENLALFTKVWQHSETAPSAADEVTSVKNAKTAAGNYFAFIPGIIDNVVSAASFIEGDADGAHGWRSENLYTGTFAAGNWTISYKLKNRAAYAHAGRIYVRVYRTTVADPLVADLTKMNSTDGYSAIISFSATAGEIKTGTFTVNIDQNRTLTNQYVFVIFNWLVTTAAGNVQAGVKFVVNEGAAEQVVTTDWVEVQSGTLEAVLTTASVQGYPGSLLGGALLGASLPQASVLSYDSKFAVDAALLAALSEVSALSFDGAFTGGAIFAAILSEASALCYDADFITGLSGLLEAVLATAVGQSYDGGLTGGASLAAALSLASALSGDSELLGGASLLAILVEAAGLSPVVALLGAATLQAALSEGSALSYAGGLSGGAIFGAVLGEANGVCLVATLSGGALFIAQLGEASGLGYPAGLSGGVALIAVLSTVSALAGDGVLTGDALFIVPISEASALSYDAYFGVGVDALLFAELVMVAAYAFAADLIGEGGGVVMERPLIIGRRRQWVNFFRP